MDRIKRIKGGLERAVERILCTHLEDAVELLPFAMGVVRHLSRAPGTGSSAEQVAHRVGSTLRTIAGGHGPRAWSNLSNDPELVASFFQNADLLEPGRPLTKAVGSAVMSAVGEMHD